MCWNATWNYGAIPPLAGTSHEMRRMIKQPRNIPGTFVNRMPVGVNRRAVRRALEIRVAKGSKPPGHVLKCRTMQLPRIKDRPVADDPAL
jgi:hypothetical protein